MKKIIVLSFLSFSFFVAQSQVKPASASEILLNLKKLNVVGSAMHIAAHPDDENTLLLTYLSKDRLVRTQYLALTRGDGGQNLIGPAQGEYVGVIRTQELQAARRIDGAEQLFSRAYDFGFSKTREETLKFWGESDILSDVVYQIRRNQPDVLITRFPPDNRAGHGHHNSSAYLAEIAFAMAADSTKFSHQLNANIRPWQAKRIVWNTFSPGFSNQKPADKGSFIGIEIEKYNPYIGKSYTEISAESRSSHKSQGFGSAPNRNVRIDYLFHKGGQAATSDLFDGIDLSWSRIKGSEKVAEYIGQAIQGYNVGNPAASVPVLVKVYQELNKLDGNNIYVKQKKTEVETLIQNCLGLWFETNPTDYSVSPTDIADVKVNVVRRSDVPIKLMRIEMIGAKKDTTLSIDTRQYEAVNLLFKVAIPSNTPISQPYWLEKPIKDRRVFQIDDQTKLNTAENIPVLQTALTCLIDGQEITFTKPWIHKTSDPVDGEVYRAYEIRPEVTANITEKVYVFADNKPKTVEVVVKAHKANVKGSVQLCRANGWKATPDSIAFEMKDKYEEQRFKFQLTPPATAAEAHISPIVNTANGSYTRGLQTIEYKHIPTQTMFPNNGSSVTKLDIKTTAKKIGYIAGAGDEVPAALNQMGCQVTLLDEGALNANLATFDAIVVGVRAYNTEDRMKFFQPKLMEYVKNGGTMVVQYVTSLGFTNDRIKVKEIGPFPFKIGRDRVTDEEAKMTWLQPNHPLMNTPNKLTDKDFDGWIQERGIYFATEWDKAYTPLFSANDPGEAEKQGSLIYCQYGKGHFIYTGLVFFRELPAGVSGAYRLFANMISIGKKK